MYSSTIIYTNLLYCYFSIYKKLVTFLNIDETGSNYPKVTTLFDVIHSFWFRPLSTVHVPEYMIIRVWMPCNVGLANYPLSCALCFCFFCFFFLGRKCHWSTWTKSVSFMRKVRFVCKKDENRPLKNFHCKSNAHDMDSKIHVVWRSTLF